MKMQTILLACIISCQAKNLRGLLPKGQQRDGRRLQEIELLSPDEQEEEASVPTSAANPPEEFILENNDPPAPEVDTPPVDLVVSVDRSTEEKTEATATVAEKKETGATMAVTEKETEVKNVITEKNTETTTVVTEKDTEATATITKSTSSDTATTARDDVPSSETSTLKVPDKTVPVSKATDTAVTSLRAEAEPASVTVVAPVDAYAGMVVKVESPDGRVMQVKLPSGVKAGQKFNVVFPPINYQEKLSELFSAVAGVKKIFDIFDFNHDNVVDADELAKAGIIQH